MLYRFDKKLRLLLFNEIEKIEIAVRCAVVNFGTEMNRIFSIRATMPIRMSRPWISLPTDPLKVYFDMCIIKYFLDIISPNNDMVDKLHGLFRKFPEIDLAALGFPKGWEEEPLWR